MKDKNIKLIIFDLWQTLVDIPEKPISGLYQIFMPDTSLTQFIKDFNESDFFIKNEKIEIQLKNIYKKYKCSGSLKNGIKYWKAIPAQSYLYQGVNELLTTLSENYTLVMLSNMERFGHEEFIFKDIFRNFDSLHFSYKTGIKKPNTELLKSISDKYSIPYNKILMVGDSLEDDILPARKIGINTFHVGKDGMLNKLFTFL